jgi:HD-GYP domain-containing protein (c-di-GMP phosphodiesterase class II)
MRIPIAPAALQELRRCCNTQFDPRVVEAIERVRHADGAALAVAS